MIIRPTESENRGDDMVEVFGKVKGFQYNSQGNLCYKGKQGGVERACWPSDRFERLRLKG